MSTTAIAATSRWTGLLKKVGLAAIFILALFYLLPTNKVPPSWNPNPNLNPHQGGESLQLPNDVPSNTQETKPVKSPQSDHDDTIEDFSRPIANAEWGLMGRQVKILADWAMGLNNGVRSDSKNLDDVLLVRFPFLKGANIYKPWNDVDATAKEVSAKRGLVMCVGSGNFHMASHLIVVLRRVLQTSVPIEIAYAGDTDLRPQHRNYLQGLGEDITLIDLLETFPAARDDLEGSGWAMKPYSILASQHTHIMLVDADAVFLNDPSKLFDSQPELNQTGTLLYHDRAALGGGDDGLNFLKAQIAAAGIQPSQHLTEHSLYYSKESWYEADSGLVAVDKSRPNVFMSIVFASWLNARAVREEVSYKLFYGDKETFWIAMELCSVEYYFEPWYAGSIGHITGEYPEDPENQETQLCSTHMLHMDHDGNTPFWFNGGIYQHKDEVDGGFARISHFWRGNVDGSNMAHWRWEDGNIACLRMKDVRPVSSDMQINLQKMYQTAANIDKEIKELSD